LKGFLPVTTDDVTDPARTDFPDRMWPSRLQFQLALFDDDEHEVSMSDQPTQGGQASSQQSSRVIRWPIALFVATSISVYIYLNWPAVAGPLRALWQAWSG